MRPMPGFAFDEVGSDVSHLVQQCFVQHYFVANTKEPPIDRQLIDAPNTIALSRRDVTQSTLHSVTEAK